MNLLLIGRKICFVRGGVANGLQFSVQKWVNNFQKFENNRYQVRKKGMSHWTTHPRDNDTNLDDSDWSRAFEKNFVLEKGEEFR